MSSGLFWGGGGVIVFWVTVYTCHLGVGVAMDAAAEVWQQAMGTRLTVNMCD